ncbi:hypothetical protein S2L_09 [Cyanophage S-2L]|nr:hypothetical protein S2L_09 [Cyanophage S-2L]
MSRSQPIHKLYLPGPLLSGLHRVSRSYMPLGDGQAVRISTWSGYAHDTHTVGVAEARADWRRYRAQGWTTTNPDLR